MRGGGEGEMGDGGYGRWGGWFFVEVWVLWGF